MGSILVGGGIPVIDWQPVRVSYFTIEKPEICTSHMELFR